MTKVALFVEIHKQREYFSPPQIQVANATSLKNLSTGASKLSDFLGLLLILI
jgi:hypothetical protein